jgi:surface antigen
MREQSMGPTPSRRRIAIGLALALVAEMTCAIPAMATPPPWAPAHGWRRKHDPHYNEYAGYTGHRWPRDYGVVSGRCDRDAIGAVLGGAVGGAVGSQIGSGAGRGVAIVLGTVLGAVIGNEIGREMDEADRGCAGQALELARDDQSVRWINAATGVTYVVVPEPSRHHGHCRSFVVEASYRGKSRRSRERACRGDDGAWRVSRD